MRKFKIVIIILIVLVLIGIIIYFPLTKELDFKKSLLGYWRLQEPINENEDTMASYLFYDYNKIQYKYTLLTNEERTTLDVAKGTYAIDKQNKKIKIKFDEDTKELDFIVNENNQIELVSNSSVDYMFMDMKLIKALPNVSMRWLAIKMRRQMLYKFLIVVMEL